MQQVYLDNNATTPLDPLVFEAMKPHFLEDFGNASSIHTYGQKANSAVENARRQVGELIGARPGEIVFTSGGTEADNTALRGVLTHHRARGNHIITAVTEHSAVLQTCEQLEKEGFRVTYLRVDREGLISLDQLEKAIEEETTLISIMHANSEIKPVSSWRRKASGSLTSEWIGRG